MGDTSPNLPLKAQMYMELARQILQLNDGVDSSDPQNQFVCEIFSKTIALAQSEIALVKAADYE